MKPALTLMLSCAAALSCSGALAATPSAVTTQEVTQLLDHLGSSGCQFNRNGSWYSSAQAKDHLISKYRYLLDKGKLTDSESFIKLAGSESSASGKPYHVQCKDSPELERAAWLSAELAKIRKAKPAQ
ncbi:DUF5329 domain-containing protein [Viridibacterium curvum]|uniref:DUF5329 domain-containing protein n=1 Tax=Viridibacterium curvum TaxID=1101404 RepID=UPI0031E74B9D